MAIKTFSNELLQKIFNNLDDDNNSLFSLLLVNKNWCENAVAILWRRPFSYNIQRDKMKKIIPTLLSQITLQERIDLGLKDILAIPTKTLFDYGWFIQQFETSLLDLIDFNYTSREKYFMAIAKIIFLKTKGLDELIYSYGFEKECKRIFTLPKSQLLLNQITKIIYHAEIYSHYSPFFDLSIYVSNIKYLSIELVCYTHKITVKFFEDLIRFISVQNNLEYFILNIVRNNDNNPHMENWRKFFFKLSEHSFHSIKYIMIKGCFNQEQTDLNFLSICSNLEELHLNSMIIDFDKMNCLMDIYLPKLFSFSLLDCFLISSERNYSIYYNWPTYIMEFLKNHRNTLKVFKMVSSHIDLSLGENYLKSILNTISLYCKNLTLIGLNLNHIFGYTNDYRYRINQQKYDKVFKEFKSVCNNCPNLQKIIFFTSEYYNFDLPDELILIIIQSLPKSLKFLSFEGVIEHDLLKEIVKNHIDNLINLDFYYYTCVDVLRREIDEISESRKLKLTFDKKRISINWTSIYKYFLDFIYF
ncbi:hypothetical protein RclHR1_06760005 [Rhizophagus clarus]|uniref:F-box domain-containing protein n=1 Tax=Rhizophagus clarus TaxID=94130 RepID=A0A2Z6S9V1_9GLOM|nr:hypothetical protein RclHR1_06760005 [Rhizophagus clarus]GES80329.1 hypothetical protein GLOIN_2v1867505 [Rhizophagus clarus]